MPTRLVELVERLPRAKVLLVGDLMVDRYVYGNAERVSPEAPVPVLHFQNEELRLGGAGNVAANLAALGAALRVVGIIGTDDIGHMLRRLLQDLNADISGIVETPRATTCKMRLVGSAQHRHPQQMLRMDFEDPSPVNPELEQQLITHATQLMDGVDVICIEDYAKGLCTPAVCRGIIATARQCGVPVIVDPPKIRDYQRYRGATAIKLNRPEAETVTGLPAQEESDYPSVAQRLLDVLDLQALILMLDKSGAYLATRDGERRLIQGKPRQVFDVTGAGDMVLAAVSAARAVGATWTEAVTLANVAGGLEVERFGVVPITREEIIQELLVEARAHIGKQWNFEHLVAELQRQRSRGKRIVFTNGCFDLIHLGHVKYFQFAKKQGDLLVVAVNTDASIRRLKGPKRPIIAEDDRVSVLEELESIDYLIRFDEDTPLRLIEAIRPDVLVKGADYAKEQVVGWDVVERSGGKVALAPLVDGRSTSGLIQRIVEAYGPDSAAGRSS